MKVFADAPEAWQIGFQDPATPVAEGIINFHHDLLFVLIIVGVVVFYILLRIGVSQAKDGVLVISKENVTLEIIWTVLPALILCLVAIPSFALLYSIEEVEPAFTIKVIGHQWYWSYECPWGCMDSYMLPEDELQYGQLRLLEVTEPLVLPINTPIRVLVTSADVIHSWAIPALGIKVDACPGRLSELYLYIQRAGVYYGQCMELCGAQHAYMPTQIIAKTQNLIL